MLFGALYLTKLVVKHNPRKFLRIELQPKKERVAELEVKASRKDSDMFKAYAARLGFHGRKSFVSWAVTVGLQQFSEQSLVEYLGNRPDVQEAVELCHSMPPPEISIRIRSSFERKS